MFGMVHSLVRQCPAGHRFVQSGICKPITEFSLNSSDISIAHHYAPVATLSDYFNHFIPCERGGNAYHGGTVVLKTTDALETVECRSPECSQDASVVAVQTAWPQVLQVIPETSGDAMDAFQNKNYIRFPAHWSLKSAFGGGTNVTYRMIGRILFHSQSSHFTAQLLIEGSTYQYDSLNLGRLKRIGSEDVINSHTHAVCMVFYDRTSSTQVCRSSGVVFSNVGMHLIFSDSDY